MHVSGIDTDCICGGAVQPSRQEQHTWCRPEAAGLKITKASSFSLPVTCACVAQWHRNMNNSEDNSDHLYQRLTQLLDTAEGSRDNVVKRRGKNSTEIINFVQ